MVFVITKHETFPACETGGIVDCWWLWCSTASVPDLGCSGPTPGPLADVEPDCLRGSPRAQIEEHLAVLRFDRCEIQKGDLVSQPDSERRITYVEIDGVRYRKELLRRYDDNGFLGRGA